jgi:hypothetical protein
VPKSRIRRRSPFTPPPERTAARLGSPRWLAPLMLALFVVGLVWIVVYYLSGAGYPVPKLGGWNLAAGFGFILSGFVVATRWK